jgi:hypothetical protein
VHYTRSVLLSSPSHLHHDGFGYVIGRWVPLLVPLLVPLIGNAVTAVCIAIKSNPTSVPGAESCFLPCPHPRSPSFVFFIRRPTWLLSSFFSISSSRTLTSSSTSCSISPSASASFLQGCHLPSSPIHASFLYSFTPLLASGSISFPRAPSPPHSLPRSLTYPLAYLPLSIELATGRQSHSSHPLISPHSPHSPHSSAFLFLSLFLFILSNRHLPHISIL